MNAFELIHAELQRQIKKGWTAAHDDTRVEGQLARAAACYAMESTGRNFDEQVAVVWPFGRAEFKPGMPVDALVKAGALIVAEIERVQRTEGRGKSAASTSSRRWVILFTSNTGVYDTWETFEGTLDQAVEHATCDQRHLNYGRNGFRIVPNAAPDLD